MPFEMPGAAGSIPAERRVQHVVVADPDADERRLRFGRALRLRLAAENERGERIFDEGIGTRNGPGGRQRRRAGHGDVVERAGRWRWRAQRAIPGSSARLRDAA